MIDINKSVTNPDLWNAINSTEGDPSERENRIIKEAMNAHFLAPVIISPIPENPSDASEIVLKEKTTISFQMIEDGEHHRFFIVFTDWDELRKWKSVENQQTLVLPFDDISKVLVNESEDAEGFVINANGMSATFRKPLLKAILNEKERRENGGIIEQVITEQTKVMLGQPRVFPTKMTQAISGYLKGVRSAKAAYLQLMMKNQEQSYLVVVDFSGDKSPIFQGIAHAAKPYLNGMYLDMVPFDSEFGQSATRSISPFYRRKTFGLL